jgi:hypothetical protein
MDETALGTIIATTFGVGTATVLLPTLPKEIGAASHENGGSVGTNQHPAAPKVMAGLVSTASKAGSQKR